MTAEEVRGVIVRAMEEWLGVADRPEWAMRLRNPSGDVAFADLDVDSLAAAEMSMMIEEGTGYACDVGDFLAYPTVNALAAFIANHISDEGR